MKTYNIEAVLKINVDIKAGSKEDAEAAFNKISPTDKCLIWGYEEEILEIVEKEPETVQ